jgi:hypothetical protein
MNTQRARRILRVFYRDYANDLSIASTHPEPLPADRLVALADQLLVAGDNFLGVIDANDVILQAYAGDDSSTITLELIYPEATGCLRLTLSRQEALDRLDRLPEHFDESLLSGAQYVD